MNHVNPRSLKVGLIGNFPPRHCGLATFTADVRNSLADRGVSVLTIVMNDRPEGYAYDDRVNFEVNSNDVKAYSSTASYLNDNNVDVVLLEHEFGIFGGPCGSHILELLRPLDMPVVTTLHTVLESPSDQQRKILELIVEYSEALVVMSQRGRDILVDFYKVDPWKVNVIPHGCPDVPKVNSDAAKCKVGLEDKKIILTFGLLSPDKGIENAIEAMPGVVRRHPDAHYLILGATHPNILERQGESYRHELKGLAQELGVANNVHFDDRFVSLDDLVDYLQAADIYLTPYLNPQQVTSGTLAYAFGLGKAIVSTPYSHARELLARGAGYLVPFGNSSAIERSVSTLLSNPQAIQALERIAYQESRATTWPVVAGELLRVLEDAVTSVRPVHLERKATAGAKLAPQSDLVNLSHLVRMTDSTGLLQHAHRSIPRRSEGYCIDDNARALLLCTKIPHQPGIQELSLTYTAFIEHAFVARHGSFHNFMSYGREWLDEVGSEDSHGRTIWALGSAVSSELMPDVCEMCKFLLLGSVEKVLTFTSPRAWAFAGLGIHSVLENGYESDRLKEILIELSQRLLRLFHTSCADNWTWFETGLAYENARVPQMALLAGAYLNNDDVLTAGLDTLRWLNTQQLDLEGRFLPIGSNFRWERNQVLPIYAQQPVEAWATIEANMAAYYLTNDSQWLEVAVTASKWFYGVNMRGLPVYDSSTGGCRDGLEQNGVSQNQGAESTLSYLFSAVEMQHASPFRKTARSPWVLL